MRALHEGSAGNTAAASLGKEQSNTIRPDCVAYRGGHRRVERQVSQLLSELRAALRLVKD